MTSQVEAGFSPSTFCHVSGDFPLGGGGETKFSACSPECKPSEYPEVSVVGDCFIYGKRKELVTDGVAQVDLAGMLVLYTKLVLYTNNTILMG